MRFVACLMTSLALLFPVMDLAHAQALPAPDDVLQVAIMHFPGYSEVDASGEPAGHTVSLLEKLLHQAGLSYQIRILPAARIWKGLEDGSVQIWPGIVNKPGLEAHTMLTRRNLGVVGINLYYQPGEQAPEWPQGIQGKRVILITNYTYTAQLMRTLNDPALNLTFHTGSSHMGAVRMLLRDRGDYLLDYRVQVDSVAKALDIDALPHLTVAEQPMRLVVSRRTPNAGGVVEALDRAYDQLSAQGVELDVTRQ